MIRREGECLKVSCDMTIPHARKLLEAGKAYLAGNAHLTLDLAEVKGVDSSALAVLLEWLRQTRKQGGSLKILHAPEDLKALAALYSLDALIAFG